MKKIFSIKKGFTLLELLIVIGILGALSTIIVVIINPVELYKQTRDTRRISDLQTIDKALSLADFESIFLGASSTVYVSIPDSSPTCANLNLPQLPNGWLYSCKTEADYRKVDSSGWIPVNFTQISQGSPLSTLPIDPINTTSFSQYYTYVPGGSYELTASLESNKYKGIDNLTGKDGGTSFNTFEIGSDLKLTPLQLEEGGGKDPSLVGYWTFDEGIGATSTDSSGYGNNGTLTNGPVWQSGMNCKVKNCLSFDGSNDYVFLPASSGSLNINSNPVTLAAWINITTTSGNSEIVGRGNGGTDGYGINASTTKINLGYHGGGNFNSNATLTTGSWYQVVGIIKGSNSQIYINGIMDSASATINVVSSSGNGSIGASNAGTEYFFNGYIDDVRIYNRALSDAEIKAIYEATK